MNYHSFFWFWRHAINKSIKNNDKTDRILTAAGKIFAEKGFYQSTIAMIAKEAGVADGTIYLYFKNKEDVFVQFFRHRTRLFFEQIRRSVDKGADAGEKLSFFIHRHLEEFQKDRDMAILYQSETHSLRRIAEEPIREMSRQYLNIISEIVEMGQEEGWVRKDLYLGLVKRMLIGAVDEVINTWIHKEGNYDLVSMADPLVDLFINGIGYKPGNGKQPLS